jgi:hypothetical protein
MRQIYPADFIFPDSIHGDHEKLHEWMIFSVPESEYYAVIAGFGIEYVIISSSPELDGYVSWLEQNNKQSPLYTPSRH